jgi:hypothetical protein
VGEQVGGRRRAGKRGRRVKTLFGIAGFANSVAAPPSSIGVSMRATGGEMKGRARFEANEIHAIEYALAVMDRSDGARKRQLQGMLRRTYRFYVSDFAPSGRRLRADDVERLIAQGVIRVRP